MDLIYLTFLNMKRLFKNKLNIIMNIIVPILVVLVMSVFYKDAFSKDLPTYIINLAETEYAEEYIQNLERIANIRVVELEKANRLLASSAIDTYYVIPYDFSEEHIKLTQVSSSSTSQDLQFALINDFNQKLKTTHILNQKLGTTFVADDLNFNIESDLLSNENDFISNDMILRILLAFVLFGAIGISYDIFELVHNNTLKRSLTTRVSDKTIVASILGGNYVFLVGTYFIVFSAYIIGFNLKLLPYLPILFFNIAILSFVSLSLGLFTARMINQEALINVFLQMVIGLTCFIGGLWLPYELLPKGVKILSKITPQYWVLQSIDHQNYTYTLIVLFFGLMLFTAGTLNVKKIAE